MLGFGASDKPAGYEIYSAAESGRRLLELMKHLGIRAWTQVFHDGGGLWTWEMLKQHPAAFQRLIMLNTIVYQAGFKPPLKFNRGFFAKGYTRLYCSKLGQRMAVNGTFKAGLKNKKVMHQDMLEGYKIPLLDNGHRALYYFFTQTCQEIPDYVKLHRSLDIPLHVIWGRHDKILVWANLEDQVKANFRHLESVDILDGKHFIQEEFPQKMAELISDYTLI